MTFEVALASPASRAILANAMGRTGDTVHAPLVLASDSAVWELDTPSTSLRLRCVPEDPGEQLLAAVRSRATLMMAADGSVCLYEFGRPVLRQTGVFEPDEELLETRVTDDGQVVALVGRMTGNAPDVPRAMFRWVRIDAALHRLEVSEDLRSRPVAWSVWGTRVVVLEPAPEGPVLRVRQRMNATRQQEPGAQDASLLTAPTAAWELMTMPDALDGRRPDACELVGSDGALAVATCDDRGAAEIGVLEGGTYRRLTRASADASVVALHRSPSAEVLLFEQVRGEQRTLGSISIHGGDVQPKGTVAMDAVVLWLDEHHVAVVEYDRVRVIT